MKVNGAHYRTIWVGRNGWSLNIIDQTKLPHAFEVIELNTLHDVAHAIKSMQVRGAPLIGASAAYGVCLALNADPSADSLENACAVLAATRPTAVNLKWALGEMRKALRNISTSEWVLAAYAKANELAEAEIETCRLIGHHGQSLIAEIAAREGRAVNVLTHCNAGWLA